MVKTSNLLGIEALWAMTLGDPHIRVAILDGPVDQSHPCFEKAHLTLLPTLVSSQPDSGEMTLHGTHVASLIFGQHQGSVQGIAPRCQGVILPIFAEQHPVSQLDLARAINQAIEAGAHLINISGGQLTEAGEASDLLATAVQRCFDNNVLIVAAAGNDGCDCLHVPAALETVLAVGAMAEDGQPLASSNWGETYQIQGILAPGTQLEGAHPAGGTIALTGTSFATPIVTGIAALLLSWQRQHGESPNPHLVRERLLQTALPCSPFPIVADRRCLRGKLNIPGILAMFKGAPMSELQKTVGTAGCGCQPISDPVPSGSESELTRVDEAPPLPIAANPSPPLTTASATAANSATTRLASAAGPAVNTMPAMATQVSAHSIESSVNAAMSDTLPTAMTPSEAPSNLAGANLIFALGTLGYDFGSEARRDSFKQLMPEWPVGDGVTVPANPYDARQMVAYIGQHLSEASSLIWTLNLELTPIYAIEPSGSFAREIYAALHSLLEGEVEAEHDLDYIQRVSIPGRLTGKTVRLFSGQVVPVVEPGTMRGIYGWKVNALVEEAIRTAAQETITALAVERAVSSEEAAAIETELRGKMDRALSSLLNRIYFDLRNLGQTSQERALNFAATNAFQTAAVLAEAVASGMELDNIAVEKSPYCRMDSDCWDVKLKFFDPENRRRARQVFRFTIDVSDIIPVTMGAVRSWRVPS